MDVGDLVVGAGLGAAKGFFDGNVKKASDERLKKEQQRKLQLLEQREAIQAAYKYKLQELEGSQKIEQEKLKHSNELEVVKAKNDGGTRGYTEKDITKFQIAAQEEYNKHRVKSETMGQQPGSRDEFYKKNYPDHIEMLGVSVEDPPPGEDSAAGSFVKSVINRVKGRGGPAPDSTVVASNASSDLPTLPAMGGGGVANASAYSPEEHGYPAPLDMSSIPEESEESSVKTIKADKEKVVKDTTPIKKAAERAVSSGVKDKSLQKSIGGWTKAVREGDTTKIYEWAEKIEDILEKVGNGKFLKEVRSIGKSFQQGGKEDKS